MEQCISSPASPRHPNIVTSGSKKDDYDCDAKLEAPKPISDVMLFTLGHLAHGSPVFTLFQLCFLSPKLRKLSGSLAAKCSAVFSS